MNKIFTIILSIMLIPNLCWAGVDLDGTDGKLTLTSTNVTTADHSIFIVCKTDSAIAEQTIYANSTTNTGFKIYLAIPSAKAVRYTKGGIVDVDSNIVWNSGKWIAIVITVKPTTVNEIKFWYRELDSATLSTNTQSNTTAVSSGTSLGTIGTNNFGEFFNGIIAELAIWTGVVLSDAEARQLINAQIKGLAKQIQPASLTEYWTLDQHSTSQSINTLVFTDLSGNGHNATGVDTGGQSVTIAETVLSYPSPILTGM